MNSLGVHAMKEDRRERVWVGASTGGLAVPRAPAGREQMLLPGHGARDRTGEAGSETPSAAFAEEPGRCPGGHLKQEQRCATGAGGTGGLCQPPRDPVSCVNNPRPVLTAGPSAVV